MTSFGRAPKAARPKSTSISELALVKKPAILVPLPSAAEDHQSKNAMTLVLKNAAVLVRDNEVKEKLFKEIHSLLTDPKKMMELTINIESLAISDADQLILQEVEKLLK